MKRTPSCSVRCAADGTLAVHCFACDVGGDVFDLVAVAHGLDTRRDFPEVLRLAAELAGVELGGIGIARGVSRARPCSAPEPNYPPATEVSDLRAACCPVGEVSEVAAWLNSRALDAGAVEDFDLARALPSGVRLPCWAGCRGKTWGEAGYRLLLPMFDKLGALRSLRARRVVPGEGPKNLAPAGCSTGGLVMADALARKLLETGRRPRVGRPRFPFGSWWRRASRISSHGGPVSPMSTRRRPPSSAWSAVAGRPASRAVCPMARG